MTCNINKLEAEKCVGCFACKNICPLNCIDKMTVKHGFDYPHIDENKCVNCGKCVSVCPVLNKNNIKFENIIFAAQATSKSQREKSSSGGIFGVIAEKLLNEGYIVYGAALDDNPYVRHVRIEDNISPIRGSKYVQSDINDVYSLIKTDLYNDNKVLFSGTPCQVEAIKRYVESTVPSKLENLVLADLICHGVGSPVVWKSYVETLKKEGDIQIISFRDKSTGWHKSSFSYLCNGEKKLLSHTECPYMNAYGSNLCIREACFSCDFKGFDRASDITLGDFWDPNVERYKIFENDNTGISTVIVHSDRALALLQQLKLEGLIVFEEYDSEKIIKYNKCAVTSIKRNKKQKKFERLLSNGYSLDKAVPVALKRSFFEKCIDKILFEIKKSR